MDKIRSLLGIRRIDRVPNSRKRELCGVRIGWMKGLRKIQWFSHVERIENDMIAKRVYVG